MYPPLQVIYSTEPLWGTAFAAVALHEHVGPNTFVGAALILGACVWSSVGPTLSLAGLATALQVIYAPLFFSSFSPTSLTCSPTRRHQPTHIRSPLHPILNTHGAQVGVAAGVDRLGQQVGSNWTDLLEKLQNAGETIPPEL